MCCINYCDSCGNCTRCGNCCAATLPLTRKEEKRIREYIKINNIEPEFFQTEKDLNLQCCFYDRKNKLCKIYEVRPSICRSFRCNKNINILEIEKEEAHKQADKNTYETSQEMLSELQEKIKVLEWDNNDKKGIENNYLDLLEENKELHSKLEEANKTIDTNIELIEHLHNKIDKAIEKIEQIRQYFDESLQPDFILLEEILKDSDIDE